jgi:hypothetical protein
MQLSHIAVVPIRAGIPVEEIAGVSAALQKQVMRDFAPVWEVQATVDYFPTLEAVPIGYWPLMIVEDGAGPGTHVDRNGQPMAYVEYGPTWSLTASHEVLEMLADPTGMRFVTGDAPSAESDRVEFLLEVCDPCQGADNAYTVNGVLVSDFYTPAYFEPLFTCGSKYSFCGALRSPRDVLPRGYLSWRSLTTGRWTKWVDDGQGPTAIDLGQLAHGPTGFRSSVDAKTGGKRHLSHAPEDHARVAAAREKLRSAVDASRARARAWRALPIGARPPSASRKTA